MAKIASSAFTLSLCPRGGFDVKFALELGASIMLDKPVVVLVMRGRTVPPGLDRVAHAVISLDNDLETEAGQMEFQRKLAEVTKTGRCPLD